MDFDRGLSKCLVLLILCALIYSTSAEDDEYRIVETALGKIRGLRRISLLNKYEFFAFKGIYYAKSPAGDLRFKVSKSTMQTIFFFLDDLYTIEIDIFVSDILLSLGVKMENNAKQMCLNFEIC